MKKRKIMSHLAGRKCIIFCIEILKSDLGQDKSLIKGYIKEEHSSNTIRAAACSSWGLTHTSTRASQWCLRCPRPGWNLITCHRCGHPNPKRWWNTKSNWFTQKRHHFLTSMMGYSKPNAKLTKALRSRCWRTVTMKPLLSLRRSTPSYSASWTTPLQPSQLTLDSKRPSSASSGKTSRSWRHPISGRTTTTIWCCPKSPSWKSSSKMSILTQTNTSSWNIS